MRSFSLSWGLDPEDSSADIPYPIYERMSADAEATHGERFARFVDRVLGATNGRWYLEAESWEELNVRHRAMR